MKNQKYLHMNNDSNFNEKEIGYKIMTNTNRVDYNNNILKTQSLTSDTNYIIKAKSMSVKKNEEILKNITMQNFHKSKITKEQLISCMMEVEIAGQRVLYKFLQDNGYTINPEEMDKNQSDGIIENSIIECKLDENEGGGLNKAQEELFDIIPNRLKSKGERIPYYRIYVELKTFLVEVYDYNCNLIEKFDWYDNPEKFKCYFYNNEKIYEYDLEDENVDIVEVIQNIYKECTIKEKMEAYNYLQKGIVGWFKPCDITKIDINRLILNNDKMNEKYVQKEQGAYFTPPQYVKISTQYVLNAIEQSKKDGYDNYVIVDRCAGVGNLESQFDEEIYSHLIIGTINDAEALTANIRFNQLADVVTIDALTADGVTFYRQEIEKYKEKNNVKKLAVIFLENPPYSQLNSNKDGGVGYKKETKNKKTWVHQQMPKTFGQDLDEQFVWSAFTYYDIYSYIHYGPIKIWKSSHLVNKEVAEAYLCNRKYFNAGESAIALFHWKNNDIEYETLEFDSDFEGKFEVKRVHETISKLFKNDGKENGICVIESRNYSFDSPRLTGSLNDDERYGDKWISKDNLLKTLPLFCASRDEISERGGIGDKKDYRIINTVYKTSDGGTEYQKDNDFLQNCLLWSLCTHLNQCSSNCEIWSWGEDNLKESLKETEIWKLYKQLSNQTKLNGLYNIDMYDELDKGKLWKLYHFIPTVNRLKKLLQSFYIDKIRPDLIKYQLIK